MSDIFFSKFDSGYFSLIIFFEIYIYFAINNDFFHHNDTFRKNKICRTFRAVGHLGTLHTSFSTVFQSY